MLCFTVVLVTLVNIAITPGYSKSSAGLMSAYSCTHYGDVVPCADASFDLEKWYQTFVNAVLQQGSVEPRDEAMCFADDLVGSLRAGQRTVLVPLFDYHPLYLYQVASLNDFHATMNRTLKWDSFVGVSGTFLEPAVRFYFVNVGYSFVIVIEDGQCPCNNLLSTGLSYCRGFALFEAGADRNTVIIELDPRVYPPKDPQKLHHITSAIAELGVHHAGRGISFWEIGCGAGSRSIRTAIKHPNARVVCTDINPWAVNITTRNSQRNGVEVQTFLYDVFVNPPPFGQLYDLVHWYIPEGGFPLIPEEVLAQYEQDHASREFCTTDSVDHGRCDLMFIDAENVFFHLDHAFPLSPLSGASSENINQLLERLFSKARSILRLGGRLLLESHQAVVFYRSRKAEIMGHDLVCKVLTKDWIECERRPLANNDL